MLLTFCSCVTWYLERGTLSRTPGRAFQRNKRPPRLFPQMQKVLWFYRGSFPPSHLSLQTCGNREGVSNSSNGQIEYTSMYSQGALRASGRGMSTASLGKLGTCSLNEPCTTPPLLTQMYRTVVIKLLVPDAVSAHDGFWQKMDISEGKSQSKRKDSFEIG